jgi:hypothetical protein
MFSRLVADKVLLASAESIPAYSETDPAMVVPAKVRNSRRTNEFFVLMIWTF